MLMGKMGIRRGAARRAAASIVPSPPRTNRSCEASATARAGCLAAPPAAPSRSPHREPVRSHALAAISVKAEPPRRVVRDRVGKGCLSFERFCQAAWAFAILLYRLFSRVEKILLISFGPGHSARANLEKLET